MGTGVPACTVWHANLSSNGTVGLYSHGTVGLYSHGTVGMYSHGTVGLYSHGTVGLFSHGAGGVPAPGVFLARLRLACVISMGKFIFSPNLAVLVYVGGGILRP